MTGIQKQMQTNSSNSLDVSVVVCTKNEEYRIEDCLKSIVNNDPDEIIVVDGESNDATISIAKKYANKVIQSCNSNLTRDRQKGIDATKNEYVAMIDADHRLSKGDLHSLLEDLRRYDFDIVQSQLISFENHNFWNKAEEQSWQLTHNFPGPKRMIGVAPAIFKKKIFDKVQFDDNITSTIDDTDFMYRLSKVSGIRYGIGQTKIRQLHFGSFKTYIRKFKWYGMGDGEFCVKHPNRASSMIFHLLIRYPVIYTLRAIKRGKFKAIPFFVLQGYVRFYGMICGVMRLSLGKKFIVEY